MPRDRCQRIGFALAIALLAGIVVCVSKPVTASAAIPTRFDRERQNTSDSVLSAAATPSPSPGTTDSQALQQEITALQREQDSLSGLFNLLLLPLAIFAAILGAGGLIGVVFSFRNESRVGQLHDLQVAGESVHQARTEETHAVLLDASEKTLTLVNNTLSLAHDASKRASEQLTNRAKRLLEEISDDATSLFIGAQFDEHFRTKLFKIVVEEPHLRNELLDLAQRLSSIEGYLEFQEIPLTASAYLVKGMAHHLRQDETRAVRFLQRAAVGDERTNPKLTEFAAYWTGYACNNARRYRQAAEVFGAARRKADEDGVVYFELARMEEESRFFELADRYFEEGPAGRPLLEAEAERGLARLRDVYDQASAAEISSSGQAIATTLGNINVWLSRVSDDQRALTFLETALQDYGRSGTSLWARFGKAEAARDKSVLEGREASVDKDEYAGLEAEANALTQRRTEPRSVTLLFETMVICLIRQEKTDVEIESALRLLRRAFADVDGSLSLYSQRWKTNVTPERFENDDISVLEPTQRRSVAALRGGNSSRTVTQGGPTE